MEKIIWKYNTETKLTDTKCSPVYITPFPLAPSTEELGIDKKILLKSVLKIEGVKMSNKLMWLNIGTTGRLL
jgi:hypothetical protein